MSYNGLVPHEQSANPVAEGVVYPVNRCDVKTGGEKINNVVRDFSAALLHPHPLQERCARAASDWSRLVSLRSPPSPALLSSASLSIPLPPSLVFSAAPRPALDSRERSFFYFYFFCIEQEPENAHGPVEAPARGWPLRQPLSLRRDVYARVCVTFPNTAKWISLFLLAFWPQTKGARGESSRNAPRIEW